MVKLCCCLVFLLLLVAGRAAATTVVAVKTPLEIVVGADSKVTDTFGNAFAGSACKIVQAGNLFFAYEGLARDRRTGFDITKTARQALQLKPDATVSERVSILTGLVATELFAELASLKQHDPETYREKIEGGQTFLKILVAGFEGDDPLLFVRQFRAVQLNSQPAGVSVVPDDCLADCREAVVIRSLGETAAIEDLPEETPGFWAEGITEGVRRLIETQIAARSEYVGPPVDILRMDKTGARWIQKKPSCPAIESRPPSKTSAPRTRRQRALHEH
ncbi:MAG TPA: hypothetical protein VGC64_07290 [Pyrinomonadaceae bacterium]